MAAVSTNVTASAFSTFKPSVEVETWPPSARARSQVSRGRIPDCLGKRMIRVDPLAGVAVHEIDADDFAFRPGRHV
ncbi:MAG: hypothetical protein WCJ30_18475 [Deltaproteobacteria bacterium]